MRVLAAACLALIPVALSVSVRVDATDCERLPTLALPNTTVTAAARVEAGAFTVGAQTYRSLPAFCRVAATLKPTQDSDIKIEVWLPQAGWNWKDMAVGNGAFSGSIAYGAMANGLARGYAVSSTDTGHEGASASFAGAFMTGIG